MKTSRAPHHCRDIHLLLKDFHLLRPAGAPARILVRIHPVVISPVSVRLVESNLADDGTRVPCESVPQTLLPSFHPRLMNPKGMQSKTDEELALLPVPFQRRLEAFPVALDCRHQAGAALREASPAEVQVCVCIENARHVNGIIQRASFGLLVIVVLHLIQASSRTPPPPPSPPSAIKARTDAAMNGPRDLGDGGEAPPPPWTMDVCAASLRALRPVRLLLWEAASTHAARATTALSASAVPSRRRLATRAEEEEATRERRLREMGAHGATAARAAAHAQASSSSHPSVTSLEDMLVDGHGRRHTYLRISLTERCNLRCQYCMPYEGNKLTDKPRLLRVDELRRLATLFVRAGVNKIRLTGGEPTIRRDIVDIARMLKHDVGVRELAITTNGVLMGSGGGIHEGSQGVDAGVSSLNVSLDSLQPQRFSVLSRYDSIVFFCVRLCANV